MLTLSHLSHTCPSGHSSVTSTNIKLAQAIEQTAHLRSVAPRAYTPIPASELCASYRPRRNSSRAAGHHTPSTVHAPIVGTAASSLPEAGEARDRVLASARIERRLRLEKVRRECEELSRECEELRRECEELRRECEELSRELLVQPPTPTLALILPWRQHTLADCTGAAPAIEAARSRDPWPL